MTVKKLGDKLNNQQESKITPANYLKSDKFLTVLAETCGSFNEAKAIVQTYLSSYLSNPMLMATDIKSQINCLVKASALRLLPNTPLGYCHIIPYGGKATFQLGYQGLVELCRRAGVTVFAMEVYEDDVFEFEIVDFEKRIKHIPKQTGKVTHIYAGWKYNDLKDVTVWSIEKVIKHAEKYSKSYKNPDGAWHNVVDKEICPVNLWMAKKTVLIDALKLAPKTHELAQAIEEDIKQDLPNNITQEQEIDISKEIEEVIKEGGEDNV